VARAHDVGLATVQLWLARAGDHQLDQVVWGDRSSAPHTTTRSRRDVEELVLQIRRELRETSVLGEYGARAVRDALRERLGPLAAIPSLRTIGRIFERSGVLDFRRRRQPAPPPGWYLSEVRTRRSELDSFDTIEGLRLGRRLDLSVLTGISLHGGLPAAWPEPSITVRRTSLALLEHWRDVGLPGYAQFDNDGRFAGGSRQPDAIGPVIKLCLRLGVVPVFAPVGEHGFQNASESFNGRWQAKLWSRFEGATLAELQAGSMRYVASVRRRIAARIEAAPPRRPFPAAAEIDPETPLTGRLVFVRRTGEAGEAIVLGRRLVVDRRWPHRLVRADVDLDEHVIRLYGLRRREPTQQRLLREIPYVPQWER
jgi:putative transposase